MDNSNDLCVEYKIQLNHSLWGGNLWDGYIKLRIPYLSEKSDFLKLKLPPSSILPSFKIFMGDKKPDRKIGNVIIFENLPQNPEIFYQLYLPPARSFCQLYELLPEIVFPIPAQFFLCTEPTPTASSLKKIKTSKVSFHSNHSKRFYNSLISFDKLRCKSNKYRKCVISLHSSTHFNVSVDEFLGIIFKLYDQCLQWLGDSNFKELNFYLDWIEPYQPRDTINSWNSGGNIYILVPGYREISASLYLALAHEIIHEWNGRKIYPDTSREWWFLEGVTQLLAFQLVLSVGLIPTEVLFNLFSNMMYEEKESSDDKGLQKTSKIDFPLPFNYPQAIRLTYKIENALQTEGRKNASLIKVLKALLKMRNGKYITEDHIIEAIGKYLDINKINKKINETSSLDDSTLREFFLRLVGRIT